MTHHITGQTVETQLQDLPNCLEGPAAWCAREMRDNEHRWLTHLTAEEIQELTQAAQTYLDQGGDIGAINTQNLPLPGLSKRLDTLRQDLLSGCGVKLLRGLPTEQYSDKLSAAIFIALGAHIGSARSQNAQGHILGHVRNTGAHSSDPSVRIYQTAERQSFHTDSADVVGLLCLRAARTGGSSLLVSAESIYNRMRHERPDLLIRLFDPIATDRRGEIPPGAKPYMEIPVLNWHRNKLTVFYQRQYIDSAQRFPDAMRLSHEHVEALDLFDSLANDPELHLSMHLQPGDMQFVYNHSQLHDRTAFTDWDEPGKQRHLLRLWLSLPGDRELPDSFRQRYGSIDVGNRGGIVTEQTVLHAPID